MQSKNKTRTSLAPCLRQDALDDAKRYKVYIIHQNCTAEAAMIICEKIENFSPALKQWYDTYVIFNSYNYYLKKTRTSSAPCLRQDVLDDAKRNEVYTIHRNCPAEAAMTIWEKIENVSPALKQWNDTYVNLIPIIII